MNIKGKKNMKNMKKILILFSLIITFTLLGQIQSNASSSDLYLNNLDFIAKINYDGSMDVTETWDIKIEDTNTLYKTFKKDKTKYSDITNVRVTQITNGEEKTLNKADKWAYHMEKDYYYGGLNNDGLFEIAWGVGLNDKRATRKYEISYTVEDAIAKYSDYAQLYWQFVGKDFEISANKIKGTILLPYNAESKENIKVWGHTEDLNGEIYVTGTNKIEFNINQFRSGRYVEIRTLFPTDMISYSGRGKEKDILGEVIKEETKWANEANAKRKRKETLNMIFAIVVSIICIIISVFLIRKLIKNVKNIFSIKKLKPTQYIEYYREIPREKDSSPAEALSIFKNANTNFNSTDLGRIFAATLLDLNLKKMIDFKVEKQDGKKETIIIKLLDKNEELIKNNDEKEIFDFLKQAMSSKEEITVKELQKYIESHSSKIQALKKRIQRKIDEELIKKQLFDAENKKQYKKLVDSITIYSILILFLMVWGIIPLVATANKMLLIPIMTIATVIIVNMIVTIILKNKINLFTQKGLDEKEQWKGLKKYMEDFSLLKEKEIPEIVLWEKFLVYATVFGIEKKVLKQLKIVYPNMENQMDVNTCSYINLMMHTNFSSNFSSAISSSMSSAYSSASGSGGGFSGGGGGGRRPVEVEVVDNSTTIN